MSNIVWPQNIKDSTAAKALEHALAQKRLGHAMLLIADQFEGADAAAFALAKNLLQGQMADYMKVQPANKQRQIGVDPMRELREFLQKGSLSGTKVVHISQAERLGHASANLFLKILEEPPTGSYIIMTTSEPYGVLPTLISRAMRFRFSSVDVGRSRQHQMLQWCEELKNFLQSDKKNSLMERVALIDAANKILTLQEEEADSEKGDETQTKEVLEALAVAKQKAIKKEFFASLEEVVLEFYKENPRESIYLTRALKAIERAYRLTEMNLNTAVAVEATINAVVEAFL